MDEKKKKLDDKVNDLNIHIEKLSSQIIGLESQLEAQTR